MNVRIKHTTVTAMLPVRTLLVLSPVNVKLALLATDPPVMVSIASFWTKFYLLNYISLFVEFNLSATWKVHHKSSHHLEL